jgi:hypothetical protein
MMHSIRPAHTLSRRSAAQAFSRSTHHALAAQALETLPAATAIRPHSGVSCAATDRLGREDGGRHAHPTRTFVQSNRCCSHPLHSCGTTHCPDRSHRHLALYCGARPARSTPKDQVRTGRTNQWSQRAKNVVMQAKRTQSRSCRGRGGRRRSSQRLTQTDTRTHTHTHTHSDS